MPRSAASSREPTQPTRKPSDTQSETDSESSDSEDDDQSLKHQNFAPVKVESALRPLRPAVARDTNEWPCYMLTDATVYLKNGEEMANLLDATIRGPLTVIGKLEFEDEDPNLDQLRHPTFRNRIIRVDQILSYSYGVRDDSEETGHVVMWAGSSTYGWFEISPSKAFTPIYAEMTKVGNAYFFLQNFYQRPGAKELPVEQVLVRYSLQSGSGLTRRDTESLMLRNAAFLLEEMNKKDGVNFYQTVFFKWLAASSPDVLKALRKANINIFVKSSTLVPSKALVSPNDPPLEEPPEPDLEPEPVQRSYASTNISDRVDDYTNKSRHPTLPEATTNAGWIVYVMETLHQDNTTFSKDTMEVKSVSSRLYIYWSVSHPPVATELLMIHAPEVRQLLDSSWHRTPIYKELGKFIPLPPALPHTEVNRRKALATVIKRRFHANKPRAPTGTRPTTYVESTGSHSGLGDRNRKNQSTTNSQGPTPIPTYGTSKAAIAQREELAREAITSGEGVTPPPKRTKSRLSGKQARLHPPGSSLKRPHPDTQQSEDDEDVQMRDTATAANHLKRARSSLGISDVSRPGTSSSSTSTESNSNFPQNDNTDFSDQEPTSIALSNKPAFPPWTINPNTHNGTWACPHPSTTNPSLPCPFMIGNPSSATAQEEYQSHLAYHASASQSTSSTHKTAAENAADAERQNLIVSESKKTGHSAVFLLQKLQELGRESKESEGKGEVIHGRAVPERIKRRLET